MNFHSERRSVMVSHLYFKEIKQSLKFALFLIFLGIIFLTFFNSGSKKIELFGMLVIVFSAQVGPKIFWSEIGGGMQFLMSKPVKKTQVLISKYCAMLTWILPFHLLVVLWARKIGISEYIHSLYFFLISMCFIHTILYESFRESMKDMIQKSNLLDFFIRYIIGPFIILSGVGLFIALNYRYITNSHMIMKVVISYFPVVAITYIVLICYSAWTLVSDKSRRDTISQFDIFRIIVINETRVHYKHFLLIIGFSFILQLFVCLFNRGFAMENIPGWMMMISALAGMFFPVMSYVDHIRSGNVYFLLSRPVKKRIIMLAFGASALIYVLGTFFISSISAVIFGTTNDTFNFLHFMFVFTMICYFVSFWGGSIYFVIKHRKFNWPEKASLIVGGLMIAGTLILMKSPVAAWIIIKRSTLDMNGIGWVFVTVYFLCSLVLVRK